MTSDHTNTRAFVLAVLRLVNGVQDMERRLLDDPISALLLRRVAQGQLEGRPFDVSSLALAVDIPAPTVSRRVMQLIHQDLLTRRRVGRSYRLMVTPKACAAMHPMLPDLRRSVRRFVLDFDDSL